jgi:hypothetical protein
MGDDAGTCSLNFFDVSQLSLSTTAGRCVGVLDSIGADIRKDLVLFSAWGKECFNLRVNPTNPFTLSESLGPGLALVR